MPFESPLTCGVLIKRYKRFLVDVLLEDGREITLHCPNTGSMKNCGEPGCRVWVRMVDKPGRTLPGTWELVETAPDEIACIHSSRANKVIGAALAVGAIAQLSGFTTIRPEVTLTQGGSRFDFLLSDPGECVVEVKSVTLALGEGTGAFPDAVSLRARKHLNELITVAENGRRACLLFCVMHSGIRRVRPADEIDPVYGQLLRESAKRGVELIAWGVVPSPAGLRWGVELPVLL
ncbi:MAG TPA: DNA/RNA nuclease SfsA [Pseudomonas xinjiangensis]|uniref:Sugar fermentation stimulation protein homolog n=1 Tax=Halopseudomonas xinjiangensis TaxID=487184 RepID=A0A7V1BM65_9GAMM|nr:DNA/RNA nuclease SfsA [Halopseudomonas xinjiangensis]HEC46456.1 DNA/RNA nuclease SfsA [Halopseudomonas xinjiangensis]